MKSLFWAGVCLEMILTVVGPVASRAGSVPSAKAVNASGAPAEVRVSAREAKQYFDMRSRLEPKLGDQWQQFQDFFPNRDSFTVAEISGFKPINVPDRKIPPQGFEVIKYGLTHPMLRESYSDVLFSEDPTQPANASKKVDDIKGALLTYSRDRKEHRDTWAAQAALLFPFVWKNEVRSDWTPDLFGVIPSVSLHRVTNEAPDAKGEVDSLIYRVGVFGRWLWSAERLDAPIFALNLRAFGTYGTDTDHESEIPAGEFEVEPQIWLSNKASLGFVGNLWPKQPTKPDLSDQSYFSYQLRVYLHGEFGVVEQARVGTLVAQEDFFRLGPVVKLKLSPFFLPRLSLDGSYSYLPAVTGPTEHDTLVSMGAEWIVYENKEEGDRISLKANFTKGGIDLTKEDVETFLVGLGATF